VSGGFLSRMQALAANSWLFASPPEGDDGMGFGEAVGAGVSTLTGSNREGGLPLFADQGRDALMGGNALARGGGRALGFVGGKAGLLTNAVGLIGDLAHASWSITVPGVDGPWAEDEFDGFLDWMKRNSMDRLGSMAGAGFGPDSGFGSLIGGLPEGVRSGFNQTFEGLERAWQETTVQAVGTIGLQSALGRSETWADEQGWENELVGEGATSGRGMGGGPAMMASPFLGVGVTFDVETWRTAYSLAQSVSPGQALHFARGEIDILNPDELEARMNNPFFGGVTGATDFALRWYLDPLVIGAKAAAIGRTRYLVRPISTAEQRERYFRSGRWEKFNDELDTIAREAESVEQLAGRIQGRWFRGDDYGGSKALMIAAAPDRGTREAVMRLLTGDMTQRAAIARRLEAQGAYVEKLESLSQQQRRARPAGPGAGAELMDPDHSIARRLAEAQQERSRLAAITYEADEVSLLSHINQHTDDWWRAYSGFVVRNGAERRQTLDGMLDFAVGERAALDQALFLANNAAVRTSLRAGQGAVRDAVRYSHWYRNSTGGRYVRATFGLRPHHVVNIEDHTRSSEQLRRMLIQANVDTADVDFFRGLHGAAEMRGTAAVESLWREAYAFSIGRIGREFNLPDAAIRDAVTKLEAGRRGATSSFGSGHGTAYSGQGRDWWRIVDESGEVIDAMPRPLAVTQTTNYLPVPDFRRARHSLQRAHDRDMLTGSYSDLAKNLREGQISFDAAVRSMPENLSDFVSRLPAVTTNTLAGALEKQRTVAVEALNSFNHYWKASALIRPSWMTRVVLGDEMMRGVFMFGATSMVRTLPRATAAYAIASARTLGPRQGAIAGALVGGVVGGLPGSLLGAGLLGGLPGRASRLPGGQGMIRWLSGATPEAGGLRGRLAVMDELGYGNVTIRGNTFSGPFGAPGDKAEMFRREVSQQPMINEVIGVHHNDLTARHRARRADRGNFEWQHRNPTDEGYGAAWEWVLNNHIGQDRLWRQAAEGIAKGEDAGTTMRRMLDWLDSADGIAYRSRIPWRTSESAQMRVGGEWQQVTRENWITNLYDEALSFTAGDPNLARAATQRKARYTEYEKAVPDITARPPVNGQAVTQLDNSSSVIEMVDSFIQRWYMTLGGHSSDKLAREPVYAMFYQRAVGRAVDMIDDAEAVAQGLARRMPNGEIRYSQRLIGDIERGSRDYARNQMRNVMFDLAERSEFGQMMRFASPFFDAFREVYLRWARLAIDNPAMTARFTNTWVNIDRQDNTWVNDQGETMVSFVIPESFGWLVNHLPGVESAVDSQGFVTFSKQQMAQLPIIGGPVPLIEAAPLVFGMGPMVQAPLSELVARRPDFDDAVELLLPYGPSRGSTALTRLLDSVSPAWARRARGLAQGDDDHAYASTRLSIARTMVTQANLGVLNVDGVSDLDHPDIAERQRQRTSFVQEIERRTRALFSLRMISNLFLPVQPVFESPYKPYIEAYRDMQREGVVTEIDPATGQEQRLSADERFMREFGEEFFWLTSSLSRSNDGVPATDLGAMLRDENRELVERYADYGYGGLIVGSEASGTAAQFDYAAYLSAFNEQISELDETPRREHRQPIQMYTDPQVRAGWIAFTRMMDYIEYVRVESGLPNLTASAAEPLRQMRDRGVEDISQRYPEWAQARERGSETIPWTERIPALHDISTHSSRREADDMRGLQQYLEAREVVLNELARRVEAGGPSTFASPANKDLEEAWDTVVAEMRERNPAFAELYWWHLESDPMTINTRMSEVAR
jgi:hypothetical protein